MKKTYEKPKLQTEDFDVEDVITVSSSGGGVPNGRLNIGQTNWEIGGLPLN